MYMTVQEQENIKYLFEYDVWYMYKYPYGTNKVSHPLVSKDTKYKCDW